MSTRPSFQFYARDWLTCPELRRCSVAARGLWADMMAHAHFGTPYGHLMDNGVAYSTDEIARLCGVSPREAAKLIAELERNRVLSRTEDEQRAIYSRRMVRDAATLQARIDGGKLGAEHGQKGASHGASGGRPPSRKGGSSRDGRGVLEPPSNPPPSSASASSEETHPNPPDGRGRVIEILSGIDGTGTAREVQLRASEALRGAGLEVDVEFEVPDRGDGRRGFVDLRVVDPPTWIELDRRVPREKSLRKLAACVGTRVVVLRSAPRAVTADAHGVDAVIGLGGPDTPQSDFAEEFFPWWRERFAAVRGKPYPPAMRGDDHELVQIEQLAGGAVEVAREQAERLFGSEFWRKNGFDLGTLRSQWAKLLGKPSGSPAPKAPAPPPTPEWKTLGFASQQALDEHREHEFNLPENRMLRCREYVRNGMAKLARENYPDEYARLEREAQVSAAGAA